MRPLTPQLLLYFPASVTHNQLFHALTTSPTSRLAEYESQLETYMDLLTQDTFGFLTRTDDIGGGTYVISAAASLRGACAHTLTSNARARQTDIERVIRTLQQRQVESIILERFGGAARRMFRLLLEKRYLEQKQVCLSQPKVLLACLTRWSLTSALACSPSRMNRSHRLQWWR